MNPIIAIWSNWNQNGRRIGKTVSSPTRQIITKLILLNWPFLKDNKRQTLTFDSKYMLGPHLFKFGQLFCSSTTNYIMFEVELFGVIPQEAIPKKTCILGILFLLIPNTLLQKKEKVLLTNTAPVNSFNGYLRQVHFCSNITKCPLQKKKPKSQQDALVCETETLEPEFEFLSNTWLVIAENLMQTYQHCMVFICHQKLKPFTWRSNYKNTRQAIRLAKESIVIIYDKIQNK